MTTLDTIAHYRIAEISYPLRNSSLPCSLPAHGHSQPGQQHDNDTRVVNNIGHRTGTDSNRDREYSNQSPEQRESLYPQSNTVGPRRANQRQYQAGKKHDANYALGSARLPVLVVVDQNSKMH
jgi:hypothetical protein